MTEPVVAPKERPKASSAWDVLLVACLVLFSGALGAALHVVVELPRETAAMAGVTVLSMLLAAHALARRTASLANLNHEIEALRNEVATLRYRTGGAADPAPGQSRPDARGHRIPQRTIARPALRPMAPPPGMPAATAERSGETPLPANPLSSGPLPIMAAPEPEIREPAPATAGASPATEEMTVLAAPAPTVVTDGTPQTDAPRAEVMAEATVAIVPEALAEAPPPAPTANREAGHEPASPNLDATLQPAPMTPFWSLRPGTHREPHASVSEPRLPDAARQPTARAPSRAALGDEPTIPLYGGTPPHVSARADHNQWPLSEPRVPTAPLDLDTMQSIVAQLTGKLGPPATAAARRSAFAEPTPISVPPPFPNPASAQRGTAAPLGPAPGPVVETQAPLGHLALIAEAVEAGRMDVCLDPILGLPDRRARHFELSVRLIAESGTVIDPEDYNDAAAGTGLLARIDAEKLSRAAGVLLRLRTRGSLASLFSSVAGESLADDNFAGTFAETLAAEEGLGSHLVITFAQAEARNFTEAHWRVVADMSAIGLKFALSDVTDLDMDFADLKARGFDFIKLDAGVFLDGLPTPNGIVPAADICRHLAGLGLALIVGGIVAEKDLARIMGFGALLGQGTLFGGPRSVEVDRAERRAA